MLAQARRHHLLRQGLRPSSKDTPRRLSHSKRQALSHSKWKVLERRRGVKQRCCRGKNNGWTNFRREQLRIMVNADATNGRRQQLFNDPEVRRRISRAWADLPRRQKLLHAALARAENAVEQAARSLAIRDASKPTARYLQDGAPADAQDLHVRDAPRPTAQVFQQQQAPWLMGDSQQPIVKHVLLEAAEAGMSASSSTSAMRRLHRPIAERADDQGMKDIIKSYRAPCGKLGLCRTKWARHWRPILGTHCRLQGLIAHHLPKAPGHIKSGRTTVETAMVFHGTAVAGNGQAESVVEVCSLAWQCNQQPRHSVLLRCFTAVDSTPPTTCTRLLHSTPANARDLHHCRPTSIAYAHKDKGLFFERSLAFCAELIKENGEKHIVWSISFVPIRWTGINSAVLELDKPFATCPLYPVLAGEMYDPLVAVEELQELLTVEDEMDLDDAFIAEIVSAHRLRRNRPRPPAGEAGDADDDDADDAAMLEAGHGPARLEGGRVLVGDAVVGSVNYPTHWSPPCVRYSCHHPAHNASCGIYGVLGIANEAAMVQWVGDAHLFATSDDHVAARPPCCSAPRRRSSR